MHPVWSEDDWVGLDRRTARAACSATSDGAALVQVVRSARQVLRTYSSSFFIVTRFLPPAKRRQVELIYAAVRYPDEIVDTFPLEPWEKRARLDLWAEHFEASLLPGDLRGQLKRGIPCFAAGFGAVVVRNGIPPEHYRAFLDAMRRDVDPPVYGTLQDLIESYIYGSAIVVGYFLAYVYGADTPARFPAALESARDLAIALQLTNFLRDVREDRQRGRVYLPADILESAGIRDLSLDNPAHLAPLHRVLVEMSAVAEDHYARAEHQLNAFAADSRVAIRACIDVYRQLNQRIGLSSEGVLARQSVPIHEKFRALPASKYWRLPLAYVGGL